MIAREKLFALAGLFLLATGTVVLYVQKSFGSQEDFMLQTASCRVPVTLLRDSEGAQGPDTVVIHGLSANRRVMLTLGEAIRRAGGDVYLLDLPGHGDNTQPFSFSRADTCAREAVLALAARGDLQTESTVLLGHSMGGDIAIRMADVFPAAATIAISPGPIVQLPDMPSFAKLPFTTPRRMPPNFFVLLAQFDPPPIRPAGEKLVALAGGIRASPEDFLQKRAVNVATLSLNTHTSIILVPQAAELVNDWIGRAINFSARPKEGTIGSILGAFSGLLGLCCLFPSVASLIGRRTVSIETSAVSPSRMSRLSLVWFGAGILAALLLMIPGESPRLLGVFSGDYLVVYLLIAGGVLNPAMRHWGGAPRSATKGIDWRGIAVGATLGFVTLFACGAFLNWQFADLWMNPPRWLRFWPLIFLFIPYLLAEERALGEPCIDLPTRTRRFARFVLLRFSIWLPMILGIVILQSGQILLFLLAIPFVLLSIAQRLGADAIRRRTRSEVAAVAFSAILAAWFVAAVFPLN